MSLFSYDGQVIDRLYTYDGQEINISGGGGGIPSPNVISSGAEVCTLLHEGVYGQTTQGSCIDDDGNIYVIYPGRGYILQYNVNTKVATVHTGMFESNAYGSASSISYNPYTGYLYIAPNKATGEVYVLNKSTFALVNTKYVHDSDGNVFSCFNLAYDRRTQHFISMEFSTGRMFVFDDDLVLVSQKTYDATHWLPVTQSMTTDGYYLYASSAGITYNGVTGPMNGVYIFDMQGNYVTSVEFNCGDTELESVIYDWTTGLWYCSVNRPNENNVYGAGPNIYFVNMKAYYTPAELEAAADVLNVSTT